MKKIILGLIVAVLTLGSCKKDKKTDLETPLTLLTAKSWKPALVDKNPGTNPANKNLYHAPLNCELDDAYQFDVNKKLNLKRGSSQCDADESVEEWTDYSVDFDKGQITIKGTTFLIAEISATQLKYYFPTNSSAAVDNVVFIFEH
ncbi:hypothetical protein [Pedobacter metabolipauper]|uniref:Lipocalin-like protein n=1 Tax=Pedobacter metabolipauper TaxID=425513 RepID=A0A4R6SRW7_9SPHI|nr:hypothetical protein [Pedobacter metabolipauper]TDQ07117.1 hypothetical protein ATK78_4133 [Pedobacter metabolipauper]